MKRPELDAIIAGLLEGTADGAAIELDAIGEAIGALPISQDEIELVLETIERSGRQVVSPPGGQGEAILKLVLTTARVLRSELGRAPRPDQIAARAAITLLEVQHALALARVIQR